MGQNREKLYGRKPAVLNCLLRRASRNKSVPFGAESSIESAHTRSVSIIELFVVLVWGMAPIAVDAAGSFDASVVSDSGYYVVEYRTYPSPIPTNRMFEMTVSIRQRLKKSPARNVTLEVDAGMPEHNHGMNTMPLVERLPDHKFRVRGMLFHMKGKWELVFAIKRGIMVDKAEQVVVIR